MGGTGVATESITTQAGMASIGRRIAEELGVGEHQVDAAVSLLDGGATVPFIARYRKEVTGGLDDGQLRTLAERLVYLRELEARRGSIIDSITGQGKMTDEQSHGRNDLIGPGIDLGGNDCGDGADVCGHGDLCVASTCGDHSVRKRQGNDLSGTLPPGSTGFAP